MHLPLGRRKRMAGQSFVQKSGVFFVILRALGFDWDTAYRTAYQAILWTDSFKITKVLHLMIDSKELEDIRSETQQVLKVWILNLIEPGLC
jgi:hypothetical protein